MPVTCWRTILLSLLVIAPAMAFVIAIGPNGPPKTTVCQALTARPARHIVLLEGVVKQRRANRLILADRTGEIRLEACPAWYRPLTFGERESVRVTGHLAPREAWHGNRPAFLVYQIQGEYGTRVTLRHNDGVPLWHRYRDLPGRQLEWENARASSDLNSRRRPDSSSN